MKTWKLALLVGGLAAVAVFGVAAVAFGGAAERVGPFAGSGGMMLAADGDGATDGDWRGCGGSGLMQDQQAREDMLALRDEHRAEMSAWWDKYGDDPTSDAAQKALDELREEHRADMLSLFEKYGVTPPEGFGEGGRGGCGFGGPGVGGGCGGRGSDGQGFGAGQGFGGQGMMGDQSGSGGTL